MSNNGKTHWAECWIDHDECLVDGLRSAAQNDYMIDQNYLPTGSLLLRAADRIAELEAERDDLIVLLSKWCEGWNDGCEPDGDLLDDTLNALEPLKDE
jgi:hypothetical protein